MEKSYSVKLDLHLDPCCFPPESCIQQPDPDCPLVCDVGNIQHTDKQ